MGIKIILSRKGMDTSIGKLASPIFTDKKMVSLPIPILIEKEKQAENLDNQKTHNDSLKEKHIDGVSSYSELINKLSGREIGNDWLYHFDPLIKNEKNSISCFGQSEAAAKYLINNLIKNKENEDWKRNGVYKIPENETIVFLFFGRYHFVEKEGDNYIYTKYKKDKKAYEYKDLHLVWGYMVVGEIINMNNKYFENQAGKFNDHPHSTNFYTKKKNNIIFLPKVNKSKVLDFSEDLILTNLNRDPIAMSIWDINKFRNQSEDGASSSNKKEKNGIPFDYEGERKNSATNPEDKDSLFLKGQWQELILTNNDECEEILKKLNLSELIKNG